MPFDREKFEQIRKQQNEVQNLISKTASFTGHRPDKLGGYDLKNPITAKLREKLSEVIEQLIVEKGIVRFITGGALGTDQIAFKRVHDLKQKYPNIQNIIAVPFEQQSQAWPEKSQLLYKNKILPLADEVVYVDTLPDYAFSSVENGVYHPAKMQLRNRYMVDNSGIVVAVYDGTKGGTGNCVKYANLTKRTIYKLDPLANFELTIQ